MTVLVLVIPPFIFKVCTFMNTCYINKECSVVQRLVLAPFLSQPTFTFQVFVGELKIVNLIDIILA